MLTLMPVSLLLAGALALVNLWLTWRVGQVRRSEHVSVGDGGNERVVRRMRAHANFAENAPIVLILVALIEANSGGGWWLAGAAALFLIARVAHPLGMDGAGHARVFGAGATMLVQLVLALWAVSIPLLAQRAASGPDAREMVEPRG
jgi:uncharacterized membrane protein YecN with MAPEG domain